MSAVATNLLGRHCTYTGVVQTPEYARPTPVRVEATVTGEITAVAVMGDRLEVWVCVIKSSKPEGGRLVGTIINVSVDRITLVENPA